jgi:hypothetical protein
MHVSKNRLAGELADTELKTLLESCHRSLVTGTIKIETPEGPGMLVLRAGAVDQAKFGSWTGQEAIDRMTAIRDGHYEIRQRLPDLRGALGSAAQLDGEVSDVPLPAIMRHCEENALSCTIIVISGYDRGEIVYRAGDLAEVRLNGNRDDDAIVAIVDWKEARFRVEAPPLDPTIEGWPSVTSEPTSPIKVGSPAYARGPEAPAPVLAAPAARKTEDRTLLVAFALVVVVLALLGLLARW